jgi:hypothetical protein
MSAIAILPAACVCGHDHKTHRGEDVYMCLECSCADHVPRCQNCAGAVPMYPIRPRLMPDHDACSARCKAQLEYALTLKAAA